MTNQQIREDENKELAATILVRQIECSNDCVSVNVTVLHCRVQVNIRHACGAVRRYAMTADREAQQMDCFVIVVVMH
jgi:hypothetical protein